MSEAKEANFSSGFLFSFTRFTRPIVRGDAVAEIRPPIRCCLSFFSAFGTHPPKIRIVHKKLGPKIPVERFSGNNWYDHT